MMKESRGYRQRLNQKLIALGLAGALTLSFAAPAFAEPAVLDELDQIAAEEAEKVLINLEEIDRLARSKGQEVKNARAELAVARAGEFSAEMGWNDYWYYMQYGSDMERAMMEDQRTTLSDAVRDARTELRYAESNAEDQALVAVYSAESQFFDYLNLQDQLAVLEDSLTAQQEALEVEKLMVDLGMSTQTSLESQQLAVKETEDGIETLKKNMDLLGRSLLRQLGMDEDTEFRVDPTLDTEALEGEYKVDNLIDAVLMNSTALKRMDEQMDKLQDNVDDGSLGVPARDVYAANLDNLKLQKEQAISSFRMACRNTVTTLETSRINLPLLEQKLAEAQKDYDTLAMRVELGLEPALSLRNGELAVTQAQMALDEAQRTYYLNLRSAQLLAKGITGHLGV